MYKQTKPASALLVEVISLCKQSNDSSGLFFSCCNEGALPARGQQIRWVLVWSWSVSGISEYIAVVTLSETPPQKLMTIRGQTWCAATPASPSICGSSSESCCSNHTTTAAASAGLTKRKVRPRGHMTDRRKHRILHLSHVGTFKRGPDEVSFLEGLRHSDCKNLVVE